MCQVLSMLHTLILDYTKDFTFCNSQYVVRCLIYLFISKFILIFYALMSHQLEIQLKTKCEFTMNEILIVYKIKKKKSC